MDFHYEESELEYWFKYFQEKDRVFIKGKMVPVGMAPSEDGQGYTIPHDKRSRDIYKLWLYQSGWIANPSKPRVLSKL